MRVYIKPRATTDDPVHVTRVEVPSESAELVKGALQRAYMSAIAMEASAAPVAFTDKEERIARRTEREGYGNKACVYGFGLAEIGALGPAESVTFYEHDSIPAAMIHAGVLFGIGTEVQAATNPEEALGQAMAQIAYIEES